MQHITLLGNLGKDPEERCTASGAKLLSFSLAVKSGKDETSWYSVIIWDRQFEQFKGMIPHLEKGRKLLLTGKLMPAKAYLNKQNEPKVELIVNPLSLHFVSRKSYAI